MAPSGKPQAAVPLAAMYSRRGMGQAIRVMNLKSELFRTAETFRREQLGGQRLRRREALKRPATLWTRQNKGLAARRERDEREAKKASEATSDAAVREAQERKTRLYESLERGRGRLSAREQEDVLVDFARKRREMGVESDDDDDGDDQKKHRARQDAEAESNDAWVEYIDEFGRTRVLRKSEVPRDARRAEDGSFVRGGAADGDDDGYGGRTMMSSDMEREERRLDWERRSHEEHEAAARPKHYNPDDEIRTKGVGFYAFSSDEEERQRQMRELNDLRAQTLTARRQHEAMQRRRSTRVEDRLRRVRERQLVLMGIEAPSRETIMKRTDDFLASLSLVS